MGSLELDHGQQTPQFFDKIDDESVGVHVMVSVIGIRGGVGYIG